MQKSFDWVAELKLKKYGVIWRFNYLMLALKKAQFKK